MSLVVARWRLLSLVTGCTVLALAWPMAGVAHGHAALEETVPADDELLDASPERLRLRFSEPVEVSRGGIDVLGADGQPVAVGAPTASDGGLLVAADVDADRSGTYSVTWNVVSADGHPIEGAFLFHVGERTGAGVAEPDGRALERAVGAVGRWLAYAAGLAVAGLLLFHRLVLDQRIFASARLRRATAVAAGAGLLGSLALLLSQIALASGKSLAGALPDVVSTYGDSRFTTVGLLRIWLWIILLSTVLKGGGRRWAPAFVTVAALAALVVPSLAGHAWTTSPAAVAVAVDGAHLLAAAVWVGGLVGLVVAASSQGALRPMAARFSTVALWAVVAVVLTGAASSWLQVRSFDALFDTSYGRLLLLKVAGVAVLVVLGFVNRRRLLPYAERMGTLLRSVRLEVVVATLVVAVTALLVNRVPGREALPRPFAATVASDTGPVLVTLEPAEVGINDIDLRFERPVDAAELRAAIGSSPARVLELQPLSATHFSAVEASLTATGTWTFTLTTVRQGQPTTTTFEVPIR